MRGRKRIILHISITAITILLLCISQTIPVIAQEYELSIVDTKYSKTREETVGEEKIVMYDVFITIANQGSDSSDEIRFTLTDDEGFSISQEYTFEGNETKTLTYDDYPLTGTGEHQLTITYGPTNTSIPKTNTNSGSKIITITYKDDSNTDTPFIHPIYIFLILILVGMYITKKKRN